MIRVMIADDHAIVRSGLGEMLRATGEMEVVAEAADGAEALDLLSRCSCDLVLLDIDMPGLGGLETLKQLSEDGYSTPVLVLSMYPEDRFGVRALRAGASGYVNKSSPPLELLEAIRTVAAGGAYVPPGLLEKLAAEVGGDTAHETPQEDLSEREFQVMRMIAEGHTVGEIADELDLSPKTVSTYRVRLLKKLAVKNNAEVTRFAMEAGLLK